MLRIITGQRGSGKTYLAVREMCLRRVAEPDRWWCTNIDVTDVFRRHMAPRLIELDYEQVVTWWRHTPPGSSMYLDEGTAHFDSRNWADTVKRAPDITGYLSHLRKVNDECHLISHDPGMVDKRVRQYCDVFDWCMSTRLATRYLGLDFKRFELFYRAVYQDEKMQTAVQGEWVLRRQWVCDMYDSYAVGTAGAVSRLSPPDCSSLPTDSHPAEKSVASNWPYYAVAVLVAAWAGVTL